MKVFDKTYRHRYYRSSNNISVTGTNVLLWVMSIVTCLFLSAPVVYGKADSTYVKSYYTNLVPRVLTDYEDMSTVFTKKTDAAHVTDHFSTGAQNFIGAEVDYRWASLSYSFGFNRNNSANNTNLRFATGFGPLHIQLNYTDLTNMDYYRIKGSNQTDTEFASRQHDIAFKNAGVKVDYVFNYKKFYYPSAVATSGQQLKSAGSFILSAGAFYQNFDLRGLADSMGALFANQYGANRFQTNRIDAGLGYAYNCVIKKRWVIYVSEVPNCSLQQIVTSSAIAYTHHRSAINFTNYAKAGIVYSWRNMWLGVYGYNSIASSNVGNYTYSDSYTSVQLHFGMILRDPKSYFEHW